MIQFPCPSCGADLKLPDQYAGKKGKCPSCKTVVTVPDGGTADPAPGQSWWEPGGSPAPQQPVDDRVAQQEEDERPRRKKRERVEVAEDDAENDNDNEVVIRNKASSSAGRPAQSGIIRILGWTLLLGAIWGFFDLMLWATLIFMGGAITFGLGFICCFNPGFLYAIIVYILCLVRSISLLSGNVGNSSPKIFCILQMILLINLDFVNFTLGLVGLLITNLPEVRQYYPTKQPIASGRRQRENDEDEEEPRPKKKRRRDEEEDEDSGD